MITVLPLPMKACTSTMVSTYSLKVSLLIVLIKILWMKLFIYIHLSQEMNAYCNSSGVQENLVNSKLVNSEYHIIQSMTFLSIANRISCTLNLADFMYV